MFTDEMRKPEKPTEAGELGGLYYVHCKLNHYGLFVSHAIIHVCLICEP